MSTETTPRSAQARNPFVKSTISVEDTAGSLVGEFVRQAATELERGNFDHAEHYLQQGLARAPEDHRCLAYLAVCEAARDPHSRAAERRAREIVDRRPEDPIGYYALGQVYLLGSRRREAFRLFRKAQKLAARERSLRMQIKRIEPRRAPIFPSLPRNHPLNVIMGRLRATLARWRRR